MPTKLTMVEKIDRILTDYPAIEKAFLAGHARIHELLAELRELEIRVAEADELLAMTGRHLWPPLPEPVRPPTLHAAIQIVLEARHNQWTNTRVIAGEITRRRLYRRRDGLAPSVNDVSARISAYPDLFQRLGWVVRMRRPLFRGESIRKDVLQTNRCVDRS